MLGVLVGTWYTQATSVFAPEDPEEPEDLPVLSSTSDPDRAETEKEVKTDLWGCEDVSYIHLSFSHPIVKGRK